MPQATDPARFRVLHTADWHLGKTLCGHERLEEHGRFLDFLLRTIAEEKIDALIVSGDVFDSANPPQTAERMYFDFLARLHALGHCTAVITAGNHDSPTHLEAPRQVLGALDVHIAGVHEAGRALIPLSRRGNPCLVVAAVPFLRDRDLRTGVFGQSADEIQQDLHRGLRACYAALAEAAAAWHERGVPVLAMGHLTMLGADPSESERPIHIGGLGSIGPDLFADVFCYGALGHLHRPQSIGGQERLRYSGSPIALSFGESTGHKEIRLLEFHGGALVENARIDITAPRQVTRLTVARADLESCLLAFQPVPGNLAPWLEIIVENPRTGENLYDVVQGMVKDHPCRVLSIAGAGGPGSLGLTLDSDEADIEADHLLANPEAVFGRRLDLLDDLTPDDRATLETAFRELHGMWLDEERREAAPDAPASAPIAAAVADA